MTDRLAGWVHRHLLMVIVGAYALAVVAPGPGLAVRGFRVGPELPLPGVLLGGLLFVAGLGADPRHLRGLARRPGVLALGLAATVVVPVLFVLAAAVALRGWHNPAEAAAAVTGLALIAALPVAGSSAAWTQTADGDLAVSLGLILGSTLLSPVTTPAALAAAGWAVGPAAGDLAGLVGGGADGFLVRFVALPSAAGLAVRFALGTARYERVRSGLKLLTAAVLAMLCYANAAAVLPGMVAEPDWDFLTLTGMVVAGLCGTGFAAGWGLGRALGLAGPQRTALMYGLGMTNNGTGLALAASALTVPEAVLPVLFCNLTQHLVAAAVRPRGAPCH